MFALSVLSARATEVSDIYHAQFRSVLQSIESNSLAMSAAGQSAEAQRIANRTGLTPEDPEIGFGYLWGRPGEIGTRKDVSFTQSIDFPTVYYRKGKLADAMNRAVDNELLTKRNEVLLEAEQYCIELVYNNVLLAQYRRQLANAVAIGEAYKRKLEVGDATLIEYNTAMLSVSNIESEINALNMERKRLQSLLTSMNGGKPVEISDTAFAAMPALPLDFNSWVTEAETANPVFARLRQNVEVAKGEVALSKAMGLPKLSAGYMGEFTRDEKFQGVTVGVSIPLWENRNKVKHARAEVAAAELSIDDARLSFRSRMNNLCDQAADLQRDINRYERVLQNNNSEPLLLKSLLAGEMSQLDYLKEMEYYLSSYEKLIRMNRDLRLIVSELYSYTL